MPKTAFQHFLQDVARARALVSHADPLPCASPEESLLRSDLLRSAWMFAVGALDAYFCDAYTDVIAAVLIAKERHPAVVLPDFFYEIKVPIRAIVEPYPSRRNWRWRMAARKLMERENVLSLETVRTLFNKFFRDRSKFFADLLDAWIVHPAAGKHLFGITPAAYRALPPTGKEAARHAAWSQLRSRFVEIIQRRHDCIHNCDRPKVAPQPLTLATTVFKVVADVEFLVTRCDEHINVEVRQFLLTAGCPPTIIGQVGY